MDRRRVNGPSGGTSLPVAVGPPNQRAHKRSRGPGQMRKLFLKTGLTPSASGSAYLEIESSPPSGPTTKFSKKSPCLKLICTVHGPRPLPRSTPFTPQLLLSSRVKFAPFASWQRRGYVPDSRERDLAAHLETSLRGSLIGERWPKSGLDVIVTILEGEEDAQSLPRDQLAETCSMMSILSGCITVASAAIADANVDSVDMVTGGMAAVVRQANGSEQVVLDPCPEDYEHLVSACVVGYLQSRDEITEVWSSGRVSQVAGGRHKSSIDSETLIDMAVEAASAVRLVLVEAIDESMG